MAVWILYPYLDCEISEDQGDHSLARRVKWHAHSLILCLIINLSVAEQVLGAKQQTGVVRHPLSELVSSVENRETGYWPFIVRKK